MSDVKGEVLVHDYDELQKKAREEGTKAYHKFRDAVTKYMRIAYRVTAIAVFALILMFAEENEGDSGNQSNETAEITKQQEVPQKKDIVAVGEKNTQTARLRVGDNCTLHGKLWAVFTREGREVARVKVGDDVTSAKVDSSLRTAKVHYEQRGSGGWANCRR